MYTGMKKLQDKYGPELVVMAFPCNQFGQQEPKGPEEIVKFVSDKFDGYKPTFMAKKSDVNGDKINNVYAFLK